MVAPGTADAEAGRERGVARDVVAGRALGQAAAEDDVFDLGRIDAGALDDVSQDVRGQRNAMGLVERAAAGLGDPGAAITNDGNVPHIHTSLFGVSVQ